MSDEKLSEEQVAEESEKVIKQLLIELAGRAIHASQVFPDPRLLAIAECCRTQILDPAIIDELLINSVVQTTQPQGQLTEHDAKLSAVHRQHMERNEELNSLFKQSAQELRNGRQENRQAHQPS